MAKRGKQSIEQGRRMLAWLLDNGPAESRRVFEAGGIHRKQGHVMMQTLEFHGFVRRVSKHANAVVWEAVPGATIIRLLEILERDGEQVPELPTPTLKQSREEFKRRYIKNSVSRSQPAMSSIERNKITSDKLARDVDKFLANGGQIEEYPSPVWSAKGKAR